MKSNSLSVTEYAAKVGKTRQAIAWQCRMNKLPQGVTAEKVGSTWVLRFRKNQ